MTFLTCPRTLRIALAIALVIGPMFVLTAPGTAHAQSIVVSQEQALPRMGPDGKHVVKRPIHAMPEGVSYQDCVDDQQIRFPLQLQGFEANASLDVWAAMGGADCKQQQHRVGPGASCWELVHGVPLQASSSRPVVEPCSR